ncbi:HAD family hydrolase [Microlunatus antarcticus]|uniref:FMN phosphatase YigB (HAD superfamily) n=1 Tax=Microlunatus antarcticus TaxID=53388 RepID=A0A7W5JS48_9ACTN|nr:HAD family hydrolase [Microlunatus antarcticus]MBB3325061.1 FMN phosphatase YigB (HAD superfamily) [Microlunatus antarcticus]
MTLAYRSGVGVLLVDLDDTLIPDGAARDSAMMSTLATFGELPALSPTEIRVWPVVREEWRATGLRLVPGLLGVSSWEALWTDFDAALADPEARAAGRAYQSRVWRRLLHESDAAPAEAVFRQAREELVRPFGWVREGLADWASVHDLWCVTNGSSWLQRRKLDLAGLKPYFGEVVVSGEVGAEKSDAKFGAQVAERLARTGSEPVAVVGDSDASDGALASFLGVRHVRVHRGTQPRLNISLDS